MSMPPDDYDGEFRVLWIRRSWVGLDALDAVGRCGRRVRRADGLVEGEIVRLVPAREGELQEVVSARIDPSYVPGPRPRLETYTLPQIDPALGPYHRLLQPVARQVQEKFSRKCPVLPRDEPPRQRRLCRELIEAHPLFLEPLVRRGVLEWLRERRERARKYLETAWKTSLLAFPPGFTGTFDVRYCANRPVFDAAEGYAKALAQFGQEDQAIALIAGLRRLDRSGAWNAEGLLPPLLLRAGREGDAVKELRGPRHPGVNAFLLALLLHTEGHEEDAVRAVCRGVCANPLLLRALFTAQPEPLDVPFRDGRATFAYHALLHARLTAGEWRKRNALVWLTKLLGVAPFYSAYERAVRIAERLDRTPPGPLATARREGIGACFSDFVTEATVRAAVGRGPGR